MEGMGSKIPLHRLLDQFDVTILMADVLSGNLIVDTRLTNVALVSSKSFRNYAVDRENLQNYLELKSSQIAKDKYNIVLEHIKSLERKLETQADIYQLVLKKVEVIIQSLNLNSEVTLNDVAECFPEHQIGSLRNILGKNKYFDEEKNIFRSYINIEGFHLPFRKIKKGRKWLADRIDFEMESEKTNSYDFKRTVSSRVKKFRGHDSTTSNS